MGRTPVAVLCAAFVITLAGCGASGHRQPASGPLRVAAKKVAAVHYRPEGLTLYAPRPGYRPPVSRGEVLTLYRNRTAAGAQLKGTPTVQLKTVNDGNPNPSAHDYPGWVVTFAHTKPTISYAPVGSAPRKADCAWVSVYDLSSRAWTYDFQHCPSRPRPGSSCNSSCTPADQPALDAAANYAEQVAGDAHCFAGVAVDDGADKTIVYLVRPPQSVLDRLRARHPGTYVFRDAPHTLSYITALQKSFDWSYWKKRGIDVTAVGPTQTGFLQVGVAKHVARARAALDAKYGRGIVRVVKQEPGIAAVATG